MKKPKPGACHEKQVMQKQQGQSVPHEERPNRKAMIWHEDPMLGRMTVPISKMWHDRATIPTVLRLNRGIKGDFL